MARKKHIVLARTNEIAETGVELDGQKMKFHRAQSAFWVEDEGKARAIQQKYGKQVAVTLDQQYTWHVNNENGNGTRMDNIHHYTFSGVDMSRIRTTRNNGWVWVNVGGGKQVRMRREKALREGCEIIPEKRRTRAERQEEELV